MYFGDDPLTTSLRYIITTLNRVLAEASPTGKWGTVKWRAVEGEVGMAANTPSTSPWHRRAAVRGKEEGEDIPRNRCTIRSAPLVCTIASHTHGR